MNTSQPVFPDFQAETNMPFFDGQTLVFCQSTGVTHVDLPTKGRIWTDVRRNKAVAEGMKDLPRNQKIAYRAWKMAYCDWSEKGIRPIVLGGHPNMPERNPSFYREGNRIHFSFISGRPTHGGFFYRLYSCSGPSFDQLDTPKPVSNQPTFFGFVSPHHICRGMMNVIDLTERATGRSFRLTTSLCRVSSVTFLAADPSKLLITGLLDWKYRCRTVLYDLATGETSDVSLGGDVYKATLHGSHLIFAQKSADDFEARTLTHGDCTLSPSTIQILKGE